MLERQTRSPRSGLLMIALVSAALALLAFAPMAPAQSIISGTGCGGLAIGYAGTGSLGTHYDISVSGGPPNALAAMLLGAPSPSVDLTIIGMTGCNMMLTAPGSAPVVLDASGFYSVGFNIISDPAIIGTVLGTQYAAIAIGVNPLGVALSDRLTLVIQA
ncbi:MAG: hypothetical protein KDB80_04070 [Planctomycetes bacterium]|nr:hypothetical protein [Planctomycetota bacterium]